MTQKSGHLICVGACAGAFGVKGEVKIKSFTEPPENIFAYGPLRGENGKVLLSVTSHRKVKGSFAACCEEIATREQAEAMKSARLYVHRADMPGLEEDEFYVEDMIGLLVYDIKGVKIGHIKAMHNFGAGDMLEIATGKGDSAAAMPDFFHPFTKAAVPEVNMGAGRITIFIDSET